MLLEEFALKLIISLLSSAIKAGVNYGASSYFAKRKIESRIENATAEAVEPLITFLSHENISEDKQQRLIETCVSELRPLTEEPALLFQGSLNGQKIFENMYADRDLPEVIIEDGTKAAYTLLCPRIAELLCKIPAAVKDWENEAWSENYERLDEIASQLKDVFIKVDQLATLPSKEADGTLTRVRQALAQKIRFQLDLTGLRADRPESGNFDDFFVHPEIKEVKEGNKEKLRELITVGTPDESFKLFTRSRHQAIIIGAPGAGKSTWSQWLQRESLSPRWTGIAVRVELRGSSGENLPSLHELIRNAAGKHFAEELTPERIGRWLDDKQIIFILDGFDEIRPTERDEVYSWIVDLTAAARGCPFVLTSRPLTTDHLDRLKAGWRRWTIEPFDNERIIDYIERWYKFTPLLADSEREVNAEGLASTWLDDPTIGPLTSNPLLLSTLLMVHHLDGSLPSGRSQLYRRYVEGMLGMWDDRRKVTATTVTLNLEQKRQILRGLALHLFLHQMDQIDEPEALIWLKTQLQKMNISLPAEDVLAMLRERSGLIIGPGIYNFAHKSIAEYLVADAILQGDQQDESGQRLDRLYLFTYRHDDRWNTVTFLWAGLAYIAEVESFIEECIKVKAFNLGAGIIVDQYDRIPAAIRRRLLLNILSKEELIPDNRYVMWVSSYPVESHINMPAYTFHIRSLTERADFGDIVYRALKEDILLWSDYSQTKGTVRVYLWQYFASHFLNLEQWKACIKELPNIHMVTKLQCLFWFAEYTFKSVLGSNEDKLESIIKAYIEVYPDLRGLIPIALICSSLQSSLMPEKEVINREKVLEILKVLPDSDSGQTMRDWLLGTSNWALGHRAFYNENIGDLLSLFLQEIRKLNEQGLLETDDTYENAVKYVEELMRRRDALVVEGSV